MKRIIYTLLGMMLSVGAWAQTLQEQINSTTDGSTVQLSEDYAGQIVVPATSNLILDLNSHKIENDKTTIINNGTLTIKDTGSNGKIVSTGNVGVAVGNNSTTTIESCIIESVEGAVITSTSTEATIIINGGTFNASDNAVIAGNGSANYKGTSTPRETPNTITINGGTFNGQIKSSGYVACGIYAPWKDVITVNGGTFNITGGCGVLARAGSVTINGGEFNCTGTATGKVGDSRVVVPCSAVVYDSQAAYPAMTTESKIEVPSTSTAKFVAASGVAAVSVVGESHIEISGGTYSSPLTEDVCAEGYIPSNTPNADGTYSAVVGSYVAQIGDKKYESLAEAITAATDGQTITLLADVIENVVVPAGKNITLDLGGKTLNGKRTANTPTIKNQGTLTVKNGNVRRSGEGSESYYVIQNMGTITLDEGLNVEGSANSSLIQNNAATAQMTFNAGTYTQTGAFIVVKNDWGTVEINGGTFTTASDKNVLNNWDQMTINGGTFTGNILNGAYDTDNNKLTINDGTFNASQIRTYLGKGKTTCPIEIKGGTFTIAQMKYVGTGNKESDTDVQVKVSGGTFANAVPEKYCADGFIPQDNGDGTYGVTEGTYVAQVGETKYTSITEAIEAATDGQTITLLADIEIETIDLLIGKTVDRNGKKIFANTFTVIDGQPCNIPYPFTANTATYSREVGDNVWGTVCLPFQLDQSDDYTLYTVTSIEGSTMTVTEYDPELTIPGESYIFQKNSAGSTISFETKTAWVIETGPVQNEELVGTFSQQKIESGLSNIYFINGDKFHQAKASLTVPAYRAYINYSASGAAPAVLQLVVDEEASAIADVAADLNGTQAIYDVNGRQLAAPQKGINIMKLANGKTVKLIIK